MIIVANGYENTFLFKNLKKWFLSHLIIKIKLAYTQIWGQSVI